jgi:hypothetical protein
VGCVVDLRSSDPEDCLGYFRLLQVYRRDADALFAKHRTLGVCGEDLVAEREVALAKVLQFLNVTNQLLTTNVRK